MNRNKEHLPSKPVNLRRRRREIQFVAAIVKIKSILFSTSFNLEGNKKKCRFFLLRLMIFFIIAQITLVCEAESGTWIAIQKIKQP